MIADEADTKNRLGQFVDAAMREPVIIRRSGREVAVILSREEYERLTSVEDRWLASEAMAAEREGYLGPEASREILSGRLNE